MSLRRTHFVEGRDQYFPYKYAGNMDWLRKFADGLNKKAAMSLRDQATFDGFGFALDFEWVLLAKLPEVDRENWGVRVV